MEIRGGEGPSPIGEVPNKPIVSKDSIKAEMCAYMPTQAIENKELTKETKQYLLENCNPEFAACMLRGAHGHS